MPKIKTTQLTELEQPTKPEVKIVTETVKTKNPVLLDKKVKVDEPSTECPEPVIISELILDAQDDEPKLGNIRRKGLTKRAKSRILFIPLLAILALLAILLPILFEIICSETIKMANTIDMLWITINWLRTCNGIVVFLVIVALIGVLQPQKPMPLLSFTCSAMIVIVFCCSIFVGFHYHSETGKAKDVKQALLRPPNINKTLELIRLEKIQRKMKCCGLVGPINSTNKPFDEKHLTSCCKPNTIGCNSKQTYTTECRKLVVPKLEQCLGMFWLMAVYPLIIGIPACVITYVYIRNVQGVSAKKCCKHSTMVQDPELYEQVIPVRRKTWRRKTWIDDLDALDNEPPPPVHHFHEELPGNAVVYTVVEHVSEPVKQKRKTRASVKTVVPPVSVPQTQAISAPPVLVPQTQPITPVSTTIKAKKTTK